MNFQKPHMIFQKNYSEKSIANNDEMANNIASHAREQLREAAQSKAKRTAPNFLCNGVFVPQVHVGNINSLFNGVERE